MSILITKVACSLQYKKQQSKKTWFRASIEASVLNMWTVFNERAHHKQRGQAVTTTASHYKVNSYICNRCQIFKINFTKPNRHANWECQTKVKPICFFEQKGSTGLLLWLFMTFRTRKNDISEISLKIVHVKLCDDCWQKDVTLHKAIHCVPRRSCRPSSSWKQITSLKTRRHSRTTLTQFNWDWHSQQTIDS